MWDSLLSGSAAYQYWLWLSVLLAVLLMLLTAVVKPYRLSLDALSLPSFPAQRVDAFWNAFLEQPISHRAGFPENTLAGVRRAKELGLKVVEMDLEYTKDGHPVMLHDSTVDRTSNGRGDIANMTLEEVKKLDFGSKYRVGERIPTLYEALDLCQELGLLLLLDVKSNGKRTSTILKELFQERNLYDSVMVVSFYPHLLYMVRSADPGIVIGLSRRAWYYTLTSDGIRRQDWKCWLQIIAPFLDVTMAICTPLFLWRLLDLRFILLCRQDLKKDTVKYWLQRNVRLLVWTFKNSEEAQPFIQDTGLPVLVDNATVLI